MPNLDRLAVRDYQVERYPASRHLLSFAFLSASNFAQNRRAIYNTHLIGQCTLEYLLSGSRPLRHQKEEKNGLQSGYLENIDRHWW